MSGWRPQDAVRQFGATSGCRVLSRRTAPVGARTVDRSQSRQAAHR